MCGGTISKEELAVVACRMSLVLFCALRSLVCWCHEKGAGHLCRVSRKRCGLDDGRYMRVCCKESWLVVKGVMRHNNKLPEPKNHRDKILESSSSFP